MHKKKIKKRGTPNFFFVRQPLPGDYACTRLMQAMHKVGNKSSKSNTNSKTTNKGKMHRERIGKCSVKKKKLCLIKKHSSPMKVETNTINLN